MFRFLVLKPLVFEECLVSWFQTPLLQILRVRLGFAVNCSAPFCSCLMNVSSPGADLVFLPFGSVLRFDECLGSWPPFCSFLMNVSAPGANYASAWATPGRVTRRASACHPPRTPPSLTLRSCHTTVRTLSERAFRHLGRHGNGKHNAAQEQSSPT